MKQSKRKMYAVLGVGVGFVVVKIVLFLVAIWLIFNLPPDYRVIGLVLFVLGLLTK